MRQTDFMLLSRESDRKDAAVRGGRLAQSTLGNHNRKGWPCPHWPTKESLARPTRPRRHRSCPPASPNQNSLPHPESMPSPTLKKWLWRAVKLGVVVLVVWFVRETLARAWRELDQYQWAMNPGWILLAGGIYILALFPSGVFWHCALRRLGQDSRFGEAIRAYYVGHLGKYVPGKAMVVILRTGMIAGHGVHVGIAAASVFLETLTWLAVGSFWAAAYLAVSLRGEHVAFWGAIGLMLLAGLPTCPPVFKRLARLARIGRSDPVIAEKLDRLNYGTLLLGWLGMGLGWAAMGLSFWATLRGMNVPSTDVVQELPRFTASVALATVAGFMVLFLPGGLVVREAVLVGLMLPYLKDVVAEPEAVAWISVALFRLVSVVSEVLISGILYVGGMRRRNAFQPPNPL